MNSRSCQVNLLTFLSYLMVTVYAVGHALIFPYKMSDLGARNGKFPRQYEGNPDFN
jgi:hypothetical protein